MQTIEIKKSNADKAFKAADEGANLKDVLAILFEGETNQEEPKDIKERVKTFEDALAIIGASENLKMLLDYNGIDKDVLASVAHAKLSIIAKALNEGWIPDWEDDDESKYYPWFEYKAGVGFSRTNYDDWYTNTYVGSRLCFKSSELALYAGKQFEVLYNQLFSL